MIQGNEYYPLGFMHESQIPRDTFREIFMDVYNILYESDFPVDINTPDFKIWYEYELDSIFILHKDSGILVTWYKFTHLGRAHQCNFKMDEDDYRLFAKLLLADLIDIKED